MSTAALLALLVVIGLVTFVYRYAMIGLFANRSLPGWLHALCRHIAPASFAALTAGELFIHGGEVVLALAAPKPWAALVAALVDLGGLDRPGPLRGQGRLPLAGPSAPAAQR